MLGSLLLSAPIGTLVWALVADPLTIKNPVPEVWEGNGRKPLDAGSLVCAGLFSVGLFLASVVATFAGYPIVSAILAALFLHIVVLWALVFIVQRVRS